MDRASFEVMMARPRARRFQTVIAARGPALQAEAPRHVGMPAEAWRLLAGQDDDSEEAELGTKEDRARATVNRHGSDGLYPR